MPINRADLLYNAVCEAIITLGVGHNERLCGRPTLQCTDDVIFTLVKLILCKHSEPPYLPAVSRDRHCYRGCLCASLIAMTMLRRIGLMDGVSLQVTGCDHMHTPRDHMAVCNTVSSIFTTHNDTFNRACQEVMIFAERDDNRLRFRSMTGFVFYPDLNMTGICRNIPVISHRDVFGSAILRNEGPIPYGMTREQNRIGAWMEELMED